MPSRPSLRGGPRPPSPSAGSTALPRYVPPPASWRPSVLVRRPPVKVRRASRAPSYLFWLVLLAAVLIGARYYQVLDLVNPNSPRATAKAFMRAIYAGDMDRTRELCTAETQPLLDPLARAGPQARRTGDTEQPREVSWRATAAEVAGGRATVTIAQTLKQGASTQSGEFLLTLVQEDGKWKVDLTKEPGARDATVSGLSGLVGWQ